MWAACAIAYSILSIARDVPWSAVRTMALTRCPSFWAMKGQRLGWQICYVGRRWCEMSCCDSICALGASLSWCLLPSPTAVAKSSISLSLQLPSAAGSREEKWPVMECISVPNSSWGSPGGNFVLVANEKWRSEKDGAVVRWGAPWKCKKWTTLNKVNQYIGQQMIGQ